MRRAYLAAESAVLILICSVVMILTGCGTTAAAGHPFISTAGHQAATAVAKAVPSPSDSPGPAAFVTAVQAAGLGNKDLNGNRAEKLVLSIGADICNLIGDEGYAQTVAYIGKSLRSITVMQAQTVVNAAIVNLCPQHADDIPGGSNG